jgi:hypothetical protein
LSTSGTFGDKSDNYVHSADTLSIEWKLKEFKRQTKSIVEREQEIEEEKRTFTASTILEKSCLSSFFTDVKQSAVAVLLCTICISGKKFTTVKNYIVLNDDIPPPPTLAHLHYCSE